MLEQTELYEDKNEFLSAIQNVLKNKSSATEADLFGAAACQFLVQGPASVEEIRDAVERIWPDSKPSYKQLDSALKVCRDLGLVYLDENAETWQLTGTGLTDIQQHSA